MSYEEEDTCMSYEEDTSHTHKHTYTHTYTRKHTEIYLSSRPFTPGTHKDARLLTVAQQKPIYGLVLVN